jgi:hypothetical protein
VSIFPRRLGIAYASGSGYLLGKVCFWRINHGADGDRDGWCEMWKCDEVSAKGSEFYVVDSWVYKILQSEDNKVQ